MKTQRKIHQTPRKIHHAKPHVKREGYRLVPTTWTTDLPEDAVEVLIGDDSRNGCALCPNEVCQEMRKVDAHKCDAGFGLVWVPEYVYVLWLPYCSDMARRYYDLIGSDTGVAYE